MQYSCRSCIAAVAATVIWSASVSAGIADSVAGFYQGKTVNIVIGAGVGGPYDNLGRTFAQYVGRYIPGNPTIVVQYMEGASSLQAAQYLYNVAPRNGSILGVIQSMTILDKLLDPSEKFEPEKFTWLGRIQPLDNVGAVWFTTGVKTIATARQKEVIFGANSGIGSTSIIPWALNAFADTQFHVIQGYASQTTEMVAMERGEIEGIGSVSLTDLVAKPGWIGEKVFILYSTTTHRQLALPNVPAIGELGQNDESRSVLQLLGSMSDIGYTVTAPPEVPPDRLRALQRAFDEVVRDPAFADEATKRGIHLSPISGQEITKSVNQDMSLPRAIIARLKAVTNAASVHK